MKFRSLKKNNKGFSLVELIVAVVILGIVVIPLLQAFTTSASLTSRARRMGEATAAAQNIQEAIESVSVANMFAQIDPSGAETGQMTNENALNLLGVTSADTTVLNDSQLVINNISSGAKTFNARVDFQAISGINNKLIAQYTDMTGTFSQPYGENRNPDALADIEYESRYGNRERYKPWKSRTVNEGDGSVYRTRSIVVEAISTQTTADPADGYEVDVSVNFHYEYFYYDLEGKNPTKKNTFKHDETYDFFPGGHHIKNYDEVVSCYLMYYPFMESYLKGENDVEKIDIHVDISNVDSNLQFKLFLVKQWPMVNDVPAPANHPLILKDHAYRFDISEQHNSEYDIETVDNTHATEEMMNVYTNANVYLDGTGLWEDYSYRIKSLSHNTYFYFYKDSKIKNQLVKTEQENRFYNVTITVFPADVDAATAADSAKLYQLKASKLK